MKDPSFFEGGKAIFTVANPQNDHYTYKIVHPENKPFFVYLLTGPDNTRSYSYLGLYNPGLKQVFTTSKSKFNSDSLPVKVIQWAIKLVSQNKAIPDGYKIQHENKCCRCGRKLITPESIENGIGPEYIKFHTNRFSLEVI